MAGLLVTLAVSTTATAAPQADLWPVFSGQTTDATTVVDHRPWGRFLAAWLVTDTADGIARVRYEAVTPTARAELDAYIRGLEAIRPTTLRRDEQFAYWANLYNAATVALILKRWPVGSIRQVRLGGLFSTGPWATPILRIDGHEVSLDDIEHRILRPIWRDPRIHYAVNCAALGCPDLRPEPWDPARLNAQLDQAARAFLRHPRALRFEGDTLHLSSLFDWYADDFGRDGPARARHIAQYLPDELAARLLGFRGRVRYAYDWRINAAD
jgi:hypothetical protein